VSRAILKLRHPEPEVRAARDRESQNATPAVHRRNGAWVIYRKTPKGFARAGNRLPKFHHNTWDSAETEAKRLAQQRPESKFVILQEQATVRMEVPRG